MDIVNHQTKVDLDTCLIAACKSNRATVVEALLAMGAFVNLCTHEGNNALMTACLLGSFEIVKMLVEAGSDLNR